MIFFKERYMLLIHCKQFLNFKVNKLATTLSLKNRQVTWKEKRRFEKSRIQRKKRISFFLSFTHSACLIIKKYQEQSSRKRQKNATKKRVIFKSKTVLVQTQQTKLMKSNEKKGIKVNPLAFSGTNLEIPELTRSNPERSRWQLCSYSCQLFAHHQPAATTLAYPRTSRPSLNTQSFLLFYFISFI